jgi:cystathionine beta-lyase
MKEIHNSFGAILGPMDSWLVLRGIKTLAARMEQQQAGAERIARWLASHPRVRRVHYPTLPDHPGREVHSRQAKGGGAVVSFDVGSGEAALSLLRAVKLPLVAVSLGGVESILSYPALMSHAAMPLEERISRGIPDGLVRLSVGLEAPADLIADLDAALARLP